MTKLPQLLLSLWVCAGAVQLALGDGVIRDGVGAISSGRGGANVAFADNGAIVLENPAGMVNIAGCSLAEVGLDVLVTDLEFYDPQNSVGAHDNPTPLPHVSVIRKSAGDSWAWGFGIFAPAGFGADYDMVNTTVSPLRSEFHYKSLGALGKIMSAAAYRLGDRWTVGANLGVAVSHAELEGPYYLQTGLMRGFPIVLDLQATGAALAWGVGAQYQLNDRTTLGIAYTGESRFDLDGNAAVDVTGLGRSRFDADLRMAWPRSLAIGLKHCLCPHQRIGVDVIWFNWSEAFNELDLTLTDPTNPLFALVVGEQINDRFPLRWRDTVSVRVGYECALCCCRTVRAGYIYHRNPVPDAFLTSFIPGILEHAFSLGYEQKYGSMRMNLAYQFSFGDDRSVDASSIAGNDFDNSAMAVSAHWAMISFLWRW